LKENHMKLKKSLALLPVALLLGPLAGVASAHEGEEHGELPKHGHVLVLGITLDETGEPSGFRKCIDLAAGRHLPLTAHHATVHTGRAGEALWKAGHAVAPTAPLWPEVRNCADLERMFG